MENIEIKSLKYDFEIEITAKIIKKGIKIQEVPILYRSRSYNEGKKVTWKDGLVALGAIIYYRFFN